MSTVDKHDLECFMKGLIKRNPGETEFHQAVREVAETLMPFVDEHRKGYGCVYFMQNMLATRNDGIETKTAVVSGSGNVALYTINCSSVRNGGRSTVTGYSLRDLIFIS